MYYSTFVIRSTPLQYSASCCNAFLSPIPDATVCPTKSTFKQQYFLADLLVWRCKTDNEYVFFVNLNTSSIIDLIGLKSVQFLRRSANFENRD